MNKQNNVEIKNISEEINNNINKEIASSDKIKNYENDRIKEIKIEKQTQIENIPINAHIESNYNINKGIISSDKIKNSENDRIKGGKIENQNENNSNQENKNNSLSSSNNSKNKDYLYIIGIIFSAICLFVFAMAISIMSNTIYLIGLTITYNKKKHCKADIYSKLKIIIVLNAISILLSILLECFSKKGNDNEEDNRENEEDNGVCLPRFFKIIICNIITSFALFGIYLASLILTQINYNSSKTWENCGSMKGWIIYGLVTSYIGVIFSFIKFVALLVILLIILINICNPQN